MDICILMETDLMLNAFKNIKYLFIVIGTILLINLKYFGQEL